MTIRLPMMLAAAVLLTSGAASAGTPSTTDESRAQAAARTNDLNRDDLTSAVTDASPAAPTRCAPRRLLARTPTTQAGTSSATWPVTGSTPQDRGWLTRRRMPAPPPLPPSMARTRWPAPCPQPHATAGMARAQFSLSRRKERRRGEGYTAEETEEAR